MNPSQSPPRALIAEDEPLLAQHLKQALNNAWPELEICAVVGNGISAVKSSLEMSPDILFFDIRMPGQSGLEAAAELADEWPSDSPFPALVFITAYEQYAIEAFEAQALDYLQKPVNTERLTQTVKRLQRWWQERQTIDANAALQQTLAQLQQLQTLLRVQTPAASHLQFLQASVGNVIHMVAVQDVVVLEAADKYVRVLTAEREFLVRTALRELQLMLDPQLFWQVHRGTIVRAASIANAQRDEQGKLTLILRERPEKIAVSRLYAQQFKSM